METLIELYHKKIAATDISFIRNIEERINWNARLISIRGARGTGKTTIILQHIKKHFSNNLSKALYVSLDNLYFSSHTLVSLAEDFAKRGGTHLFIDEVHKYPDWSVEIKNIYDDYPELHVAFTGSSLLEILNGRADLSRRALTYEIQGLSFREYLAIKENIDLPIFSFEEILKKNAELSAQIVSKIKPFQYFEEYLKTGYYPFFMEGKEDYYSRLNETVSMILDIELPVLRNVEVSCIPKIKKLLAVIGRSAPFIPNITELAGQTGLARQSLIQYLKYLEDAKLISQIFKESRGLGVLTKPDKIYLENTNLMFLLDGDSTNKGNLRETFVQNQICYSHKILFSEQSDFLIDGKWTLEVGGKNKTRKQIKDIENSFIVADDIEYGTDKRIPIWLFGFLY